MNCPSCQTENPDGAKFCMSCGSKLQLTCPECATPLPAGAKFCFNCGHQMGAPAPPPPAPAPVAANLERFIPRELMGKLQNTRHQLVSWYVERAYVEGDDVVAMTLKSNYHLVLGHNVMDTTDFDYKSNPTESIGSDIEEAVKTKKPRLLAGFSCTNSTAIVSSAGATGLEPAIFGLTGRRVNHYTTPPEPHCI